MRKLLAGSILAVGLALSPAWASTPKDTLVMAKNIDDIVSLDPAEAFEPTGNELVANLYDRLVGYEAEDVTKLVPAAAESYTVSDDGKTLTFKLRPGLKFASGNPVTAEDVAFSLQRAVILNLTPAFILSEFGWTLDNVKELVKAVDPRTVQLTITENYSPLFVLDCLASGVGSIVEKKAAMAHQVNGDLGNDWLKTHSAGSGPFKLKAWRESESVALDAVPGARTPPAQMKRVVIRHVSDAPEQRGMLERGEVDIARDLTPAEAAALAGNKNVAVEDDATSQIYYMGLNQKVAALAKPKVREAIRWLIDYQGLADGALKGSSKVHQAFWPAGLACSLTDTPFHLDVDKAKALLAEAGYPTGFEVEIEALNRTPIAGIADSVKATLGQAGIKATVTAEARKDLITKYRARDLQIVLLPWEPDYLDPHASADSFARNPNNADDAKSKPIAWRNAWDIPEITAETRAAVRERDGDKRCQMYLDLQKKLQADGALIVMFQQAEALASRANVKGFFAGPTSDLVFYRGVTK